MVDRATRTLSGPGGAGKAFLHDRVAEHVRALIRDGVLQPGERVPSLRQVRRRFGVSMATATRAYESLEAAGWIEARPQSGFYVRRAHGLDLQRPGRGEPPGRPERVDTAGLVRALVSAADDTPDAVALAFAHPDASLLPMKALQRSLSRVSRRDPMASTRYAFAPGAETLRRQIAYRAGDGGGRVHPDEVLVTSGCTEALAVALQAVTRPGDVVAVESPTFFNILTVLETLGLQALELPTDPHTGLDLDALEHRLDRGGIDAVLVIPNFSNPLGSCMPEEAKRRLARLASQHDVAVIEDDIYGELHFGPQRPPLIRAFDETGHVLTASSFSKTIAPGHRVGWLLPGPYLERATGVKHALSLATATLPQLAIADFLESGGFDRHLKRVRQRYREQVERMRREIAHRFPDGTRVTDPDGGFLLWVQLPDGVHAVELYRRAIEQGIRIAPGNLFSTSSAYDDYVRVSCGMPWSPAVSEAVATLGELVSELAGAR